MKTLKRKNFTAIQSGDGTVEGYASTFGNIDHAGEIVEPGAFKKTLQSGKTIPLLWQHDTTVPIGVVEVLEVDKKGLWFRARFDDTTAGQDARKSMLNGSTNSFSIGYRVINWKNDEVQGRPVVRLTEIALMEISVVTFPCNELAQATAVKAAPEGEQLSPEMMGLLTDFAKFLFARQAEGANDAQNAPETPVEGEEAPVSTEDAPADDEAAADAPEGEDEPADAPEPEDDAEKAPKAPSDDEEEDEEEDEKTKKALEDLLMSFKLDAILENLRL